LTTPAKSLHQWVRKHLLGIFTIFTKRGYRILGFGQGVWNMLYYQLIQTAQGLFPPGVAVQVAACLKSRFGGSFGSCLPYMLKTKLFICSSALLSVYFFDP
jgi:hypothetical protein